MTSGEQQAVSSSSGRGMPGIAVTDAATINTQLGVEALPNGFVSLPVYTFVEKSVEDDVGFGGCHVCDVTVTQRRNSNSNYIDYWWVADFVRDPIAESLGIPTVEIDAMPAFPDVYDRTDVYVTHEFEGIPYPDTFDNNTCLEMRSMQKIELVYMFTRDTRRLAFSRMLSKPMA